MLCAHCVMKTRNNIDENVHLILEQNDVIHEFEKEKKVDCMDFDISIRNTITTCTMKIFLFLEDGTIIKKKQRMVRVVFVYVDIHLCFPFHVCIHDIYVYYILYIYMYTHMYINILNVQYSDKYIYKYTYNSTCISQILKHK